MPDAHSILSFKPPQIPLINGILSRTHKSYFMKVRMTIMYKTNIKTAFVFFVGIAFCLYGCGKNFDNSVAELGLTFDNPTVSGRLSPSFSADILAILTQQCALSGCHVADGPGRCRSQDLRDPSKGRRTRCYSYCRKCERKRTCRRNCYRQNAARKGRYWKLPRSNTSSIGSTMGQRITKFFTII